MKVRAARNLASNANRVLETMDARTYWNHYTEQHGGPSGVARRLGIPYSTIAGLCNGSRGCGRDLALRMHAADPLLDPSVLIFLRAKRAAATDKAA